MNECPFCKLPQTTRRQLEIKLHRGEHTYAWVDAKYGWPVGTASTHMREHIEYTPEEERMVEEMRTESIDTLNTAESILQRMVGWLDELEDLKDREGMTPEWVATATKLVGQTTSSLKLVGQLKKEIGVDSQLFLADQRMNMLSSILIEVLSDKPHLLDQIELRFAALKTPNHIQDADFEVDLE